MDEDDFEYWFNASPEECRREDARLDNEIAELDRRLSAMTIPQQVAHHRHFLLIDIIDNRRRIKDPTLNTIEFISNMWRENLKTRQLRLVKLRYWRATGVYPGSA